MRHIHYIIMYVLQVILYVFFTWHFYLFVQIHYKYWFLFWIKKTFGIFIKFGESFSLGSLFNESQTYQDNPCGVYPDLSSFTGSGVIQVSVACIKRSAPSQVHIIQLAQQVYKLYNLRFQGSSKPKHISIIPNPYNK